MLEFPPFRHVNWILDKAPPRFDLAMSNILPEWSGHLPSLDPQDMMRIGNPRGDPDLVSFLSKEYGVDRDRILITNGTSEANYLAYLSVLSKGSKVLIEKPVYTPLLEVPRALGCDISFIKRRPDDYRIDHRELRGKLEEGADLLVLQNHNNPSGKALTTQELKDIARACADNDVPVLCDEVYRDYALSPSGDGLTNPIAPMSTLYEKGITTSSVTKVYGATGIVTGWMVASKRVISRARKIKIMTVPMVSNYGNRVALAALKARDRVLPHAFAELRERSRLVRTWAKGRSDVRWSEPDGCAIGFLRYEYDMPSVQFCERLYSEYGTRAIPGAFFHIERGIRIGMTRSYDELKGGLEMIDSMLDDIA